MKSSRRSCSPIARQWEQPDATIHSLDLAIINSMCFCAGALVGGVKVETRLLQFCSERVSLFLAYAKCALANWISALAPNARKMTMRRRPGFNQSTCVPFHFDDYGVTTGGHGTRLPHGNARAGHIHPHLNIADFHLQDQADLIIRIPLYRENGDLISHHACLFENPSGNLLLHEVRGTTTWPTRPPPTIAARCCSWCHGGNDFHRGLCPRLSAYRRLHTLARSACCSGIPIITPFRSAYSRLRPAFSVTGSDYPTASGAYRRGDADWGGARRLSCRRGMGFLAAQSPARPRAPSITTNAGDLLGNLNAIKAPSCNDAALRVLGLSFAGWNVIASVALAAIAFYGASRKSR